MERVPLVRPDIGDEEIEAVARVIRSYWVTQGPEVAAFETEFASFVGARNAVAVANCTVALELCLRVLGVGPGDEVVTVSHTFIATPNAVVAVGAVPVFVDVEGDTFGMDPRQLAGAITPRTKAVLCVHQLGIPCDLEGILAVADAAGLPAIEDAACAIGSEILWGGAWQRIGRPHGRLACFSFHPRKVLTTGDGGMITTSDAALATRLRSLRQHAMSVSDTARHRAESAVFEEYLEPAYNYRLTDLQAAVGRPQLRRLEGALRRRHEIAATYAQALAQHAVLAPPAPRATARWNWQSYPATLRQTGGMEQKGCLDFLLARGIASKRGVSNAHQEPAYAQRGGWRMDALGLPVSERLRDTIVLLPLFHSMTAEEVEAVLRGLDALHAHSGGKGR